MRDGDSLICTWPRCRQAVLAGGAQQFQRPDGAVDRYCPRHASAAMDAPEPLSNHSASATDAEIATARIRQEEETELQAQAAADESADRGLWL